MRAPWLCAVVAALLGAALAGAAEITALPAQNGSSLTRGVAALRCAIPMTELVSNSRGTLVDVGPDAHAEVLLTTAHGLPPDSQAAKRDCRVIVRGEAHTIIEVWHAGGDAAGPEHDWAVVLTQRIAGDVHRWRAARVAPEWLVQAVAQSSPVRLVLRSAEPANTECRLQSLTPDPELLLAHTCFTHPGTSGSPLVVGIDSGAVLLGIHVGSQMQWRGTKLDFVGVARPLDSEVVAAIEAAAQRASEPLPTLPRRRR